MQSVVYAAESKQLLSGGDDSAVVFWNVDVKRQEVCLRFTEVHLISSAYV